MSEKPASSSQETNKAVERAKKALEVGRVAVALVSAVGAMTYGGLKATDVVRHGGEDHPVAEERALLTAKQLQRIDQAAAWSAQRINQQSGEGGLSLQRDVSIDNGQLVVEGSEKLTKRGNGAHGTTIRTEIRFSGAPDATDPASVSNFLAGKPHVKNIDVQNKKFLSGVHTTLRISNSDEGKQVQITYPDNEGYNIGNVDAREFYEFSAIQKAEVIALGVRDLDIGGINDDNGIVDGVEEAKKYF
jgi:hypothetical protein